MQALSLADASVSDELQCAICFELMTNPVSLKCQHSFCTLCIQRTAAQNGSLHCPLCRKRSHSVESLTENKMLRVMCDLAKEARDAQCPNHEGHVMDYYCTTCDTPVCDRCVIMGSDHRGHEIVQLADANSKTLSKLSTLQKEIQRRVETPACGRAEAVYEGLAGLVDEAADDAVTHIEKLRRQAKAQLSSHKLKEVSHLSSNTKVMKEAAQGIAQVLAELPRGSRQASNPTTAQGRLVDYWQNKLTQASMQVPEWDASRAADFLQGLSSFTTLQKASPANRPMQVLISQPGSQTITASIRPGDTAGDVKLGLQRHTGFPVERQCLYLGGKPLDDKLPVSAQGVTQHAMIQLRFRASVGPDQVLAWQKDAKEWQKRKRGPSAPRARGS